ncbi:MAG: caspase family protein [Paracoccaceae bacterium]|nr:MAG: caspase family protein [Paracoccaceae bacterium]
MWLNRLALLAFCTATPAMAEVRAVLVGVGDYLHLDADLRGPPHDVALMARVLTGRGVPGGSIEALISAPDLPDLPTGVVSGLPTRAGVLAAMDRLAGASRPGDTVLFYFSGHGSQAPDRDGDEVTGMDQILLPADARGWRGATGDVENAIVDDELQVWARGLLERGVRVVGVIDACHSGTGFRAVGGHGVARVIDAETLGVPEAVPPAVAPPPPPPLPGDFAFLYAAQSDQRSFEYPLDAADPAGQWQGGFTLALARALTQHPDLTWRQALRLVRDDLAAAAQRQDPDGEGPLMDAPVFGQGAGATRMAVAGGGLAAGLIDGLDEGARVALYDRPQGGTPLAEARVTAARATTAMLDPAPPDGALWAEVVAPAPPPPLRMATPVRAAPDDGFDYGPWVAALSLATAEGLAERGDPADLVPILTGGSVALAGGDGVLDPAGPGSTPRIVLREGETEAEATLRTIETAAHALRLRAVLTRLAGRGPGALGRIGMTMERRPGRLAGGECQRAGDAVPVASGVGASPCDELWLTLTNSTGKAQDVTVFWQGHDFTVTPVWPARSLSGRLPHGGTARVGLRITPDTPAPGVEELLVVAVAADLRGDSAPLAALATPDRLRATGSDATLAAVDALMDPDSAGTRAFTAARPPLMILREPLRIAPPAP